MKADKGVAKVYKIINPDKPQKIEKITPFIFDISPVTIGLSAVLCISLSVSTSNT